MLSMKEVMTSPVACPADQTFVTIRPEKSFWKKESDWRATCT